MTLDMDDFKAFSLRFGDIQGSPIPGINAIGQGYGGVGTLSNLKQDGKYVGAAYAAPGTQVSLTARGKPLAAKIVPMPFVPHHYFRGA